MWESIFCKVIQNISTSLIIFNSSSSQLNEIIGCAFWRTFHYAISLGGTAKPLFLLAKVFKSLINVWFDYGSCLETNFQFMALRRLMARQSCIGDKSPCNWSTDMYSCSLYCGTLHYVCKIYGLWWLWDQIPMVKFKIWFVIDVDNQDSRQKTTNELNIHE